MELIFFDTVALDESSLGPEARSQGMRHEVVSCRKHKRLGSGQRYTASAPARQPTRTYATSSTSCAIPGSGWPTIISSPSTSTPTGQPWRRELHWVLPLRI